MCLVETPATLIMRLERLMIGALGRAVASDWPKVIAARTRRTSVTAPAYGLPLYQPPRRLLTVANDCHRAWGSRTTWVPVSHREQPLEEIAVAPQGETKVFGGRLFATSPLFLEPRTRFGESNRELVDHIRHQAVRFVDAFFGIVDESRLHVVPARTKTGELIVGEQLSEPPHTLKVAATFHGVRVCGSSTVTSRNTPRHNCSTTEGDVTTSKDIHRSSKAIYGGFLRVRVPLAPPKPQLRMTVSSLGLLRQPAYTTGHQVVPLPSSDGVRQHCERGCRI